VSHRAPSALLGLVLVLALVPPGCLYVGARARVGPRIDPGVVATIEAGTTTRSEVLTLLGPPAEHMEPELAAVLFDDNLRLDGVLDVARRAESLWTWQGDQALADGTMLLLWNGLWVETRTDLVVVGFDEAGVVTAVASTLEGSW
jgi:hypothetical protein